MSDTSLSQNSDDRQPDDTGGDQIVFNARRASSQAEVNEKWRELQKQLKMKSRENALLALGDIDKNFNAKDKSVSLAEVNQRFNAVLRRFNGL